MAWLVIPCSVRTRQEYSECYPETFSINFARYDAVLENQGRVVPANVIRNWRLVILHSVRNLVVII